MFSNKTLKLPSSLFSPISKSPSTRLPAIHSPSHALQLKKTPNLIDGILTQLNKQRKSIQERRLQRRNHFSKAKSLEKTYFVKFRPSDLYRFNLTQLKKRAVTVFQTNKETRAAVRIQRWFRKHLNRKTKLISQNILHLKAFKIQIYWKKFTVRLVEKRKRNKNQQCALLVQKKFRAFVETKVFSEQKFRKEVDQAMEYFGNLRTVLEKHSAIVIQKWWRTLKQSLEIKRKNLDALKVNFVKSKISLAPVQESSEDIPEKLPSLDRLKTIDEVKKPTKRKIFIDKTPMSAKPKIKNSIKIKPIAK